nr:MAG TPA: hypothetical protein [Caudoviricetes sp.]
MHCIRLPSQISYLTKSMVLIICNLGQLGR